MPRTNSANQLRKTFYFTLESCLTTDSRYNTLDSIESIHPEMKGLKDHLCRYLSDVVGEKSTPEESLQAFGEIYIVAFDKNNIQQEKGTIEVGQDICFKGESDGSSASSLCYGQVACFLEVRCGDEKTYQLCAGTTFEDLKIPHDTGYRVLKKRDTVFVTLLDRIKYGVSIAPSFDDDDTYLLNHDISRECWEDAEPLLPELDVLVTWRQDTEPAMEEEVIGVEEDEEFATLGEVIVSNFEDDESEQETKSDTDEDLYINLYIIDCLLPC